MSDPGAKRGRLFGKPTGGLVPLAPAPAPAASAPENRGAFAPPAQPAAPAPSLNAPPPAPPEPAVPDDIPELVAPAELPAEASSATPPFPPDDGPTLEDLPAHLRRTHGLRYDGAEHTVLREPSAEDDGDPTTADAPAPNPEEPVVEGPLVEALKDLWGPPPPPPLVRVVRENNVPLSKSRTTFTGTAPGKIILIGEHAVVYGYRAIASALSLTTTVSLRRRPGATALEEGPDDPRLTLALAEVLPPEGFAVRIRSDVPMGAGMGSSAALSIALLRALAAAEGREPTPAELIEQGFRLERIFHGEPSGLDHTVSTLGGAVLYRRGTPPEPLLLPVALKLVIANTGTPGNTAEMVSRVRRRRPEELLMRLGALTEMTAARLARGEPIGAFVREAHRVLRLLAVSTPQLDELCRAMEAAGAAGAKLAGAGGGGVAVAVVDARSEDAVRRAAEAQTKAGVYVTSIGGAPRFPG